MPLLYVDLLGMKAQWQAGGVPTARRRYAEFGDIIVEGLRALPPGTDVGGGVQSDAAALTFTDARSAVVVGRAIFRTAFWSGWSSNRTWIRGLVSEHRWPPGAPLEKARPLRGAPVGVFERHFQRPLLNAINLEQSGFRGQRLLIEETLLSEELERSLATYVGGRPFAPFIKLDHSSYPRAVCDFKDVLWMLEGNDDEWRKSKLQMQNLLRWSSAGGDAELVQASATHLVFAQVDAIRFGLTNASAWRGDKTDPHVRDLWSRLCHTLALAAQSHRVP